MECVCVSFKYNTRFVFFLSLVFLIFLDCFLILLYIFLNLIKQKQKNVYDLYFLNWCNEAWVVKFYIFQNLLLNFIFDHYKNKFYIKFYIEFYITFSYFLYKIFYGIIIHTCTGAAGRWDAFTNKSKMYEQRQTSTSFAPNN